MLKRITQLRMLAQAGFSIAPRAIVNYVRYKTARLDERMSLARFRPITYSCVVTRRCNLQCAWCTNPPIPAGQSWQAYEATVEKMERILDHPLVRDCLYISLSGGEPLLVESVADIIRLIRRKGHLAGMATNGLLLPERMDELRHCGINQVSVSLYPSNIARLEHILPMASRSLPVRTSRLCLRSEIESRPEVIEEAIRLSRDSGCFGMVITPCIPGSDVGIDELIYDDCAAFIDFRERISRKYRPFQVHFHEPVHRAHAPGEKRCRLLWAWLMSDMMGNIGICCHHYADPHGAWGNLFELSPEASVNLPQKMRMRRIMLEKSACIPEECAGCYIMADKWVANY